MTTSSNLSRLTLAATCTLFCLLGCNEYEAPRPCATPWDGGDCPSGCWPVIAEAAIGPECDDVEIQVGCARGDRDRSQQGDRPAVYGYPAIDRTTGFLVSIRDWLRGWENSPDLYRPGVDPPEEQTRPDPARLLECGSDVAGYYEQLGLAPPEGF